MCAHRAIQLSSGWAGYSTIPGIIFERKKAKKQKTNLAL